MKRIIELIKSQKQIIENFSYLGLAQLFNMLAPFIILPYLISVLGIENYGKVVLVQTAAYYFIIIIRFGLNLVGARNIAENEDNKEEKNKIFSIIFYLKSIFIILIYLSLFLFTQLFNVDKDLFIFYSFGVLIALNELLFPQWFFQGIQKLKYVTIISLVIKIIFTSLIFLIIKNENQYIYVPLIIGLGNISGGLLSLKIVFFNEKIKLVKVNFSEMKIVIKDSIPLFLSSVIISIKDKSNVIFINLILGASAVSIYEIGIKFMNLVLMPIDIINSSIYPKMSKEKNIKYLIKIMRFTFLLTLLIIIIAFFLITPFLNIYSPQLLEAVNIIRILLIAPLIFSLSLPLSINGLIIFNKNKYLLVGMILTVSFYFTLLSIFYVLGKLNNVIDFAIITVLVYLFELAYRYIVCKRLKII